MDESIEIFGTPMSMGDAIDYIYKNLQDLLNNCHTGTRSLVMLNDDDSSFKRSHMIANDILDFTHDLKLLLGELDKVMKKLGFKPESAEEKEWLKEFNTTRKDARKTRNGSNLKK